MKQTQDIDEAVYEVVNVLETRKNGRRDRDIGKFSARLVRSEEDSDESEDEDIGRSIRKGRIKADKNKPITEVETSHEKQETLTAHGESSRDHSIPSTLIQAIQSMSQSSSNISKTLETMNEKLSNLEKQKRPQFAHQKNQSNPTKPVCFRASNNILPLKGNQSRTPSRTPGISKPYACLKCGEVRHFIRKNVQFW